MKPHPLIVANWKMYPSVADAIVIANGVKKALREMEHLEVVLCPPSIMIPVVHEIITDHKLPRLHLGVQNIYQLDEGPYTGEISASMAKNFADYALVGHSERVKWFHETVHESNLKLKSALKNGLTPIICVGETRKNSRSMGEIMVRLEAVLRDIPKKDYENLIIAYEPVWAIANGEPKSENAASGDYAQAAAAQIRKRVGLHSRILYGGSTNAENIAEFLYQDDIDGVLAGAASVDLKEFIKMCEIASAMR